MTRGYRHHKRFIVKRLRDQPLRVKWIGHDGHIDFTLSKQLEKLRSEVLLQQHGHSRRVADHLTYQLRQQIRANRVDDADFHRA